jgi:hypothetical protein
MLLLPLLYHDPNPRTSHTTPTTIDPTHKIPLLRKHLIYTTSQIKAVVKKERCCASEQSLLGLGELGVVRE